MITFEVDSSKQGVEIFLDSNGVDELIGYLQYIKSNNDHFHLNAGNELQEKKESSDASSTLVKHVKIVYLE